MRLKLDARGKKKRSWGGEHELQKSFFVWLAVQYPTLYSVAFAIPNGVKCSITQGAKLKAEGMKKGIPDVCIPYPTPIYPSLFIEFKYKKNKLTPEQEGMLEKLSALGYKCCVCYTLDEAMKVVNDYVT